MSSDEEIGPQLTEQVKQEPEPLTRDDSWRTSVTLTREWDKGKHCKFMKQPLVCTTLALFLSYLESICKDY